MTLPTLPIAPASPDPALPDPTPSARLPSTRVRLRLDADPQSVRDGLCHLMATDPLRTLAKDLRGSTEIVLAEVLNNIVEHAYAQSEGHIDLILDYNPPDLGFEVVDNGRPMPDCALPPGDLATPGDNGDLPEGGFGWFLIRSLTEDLVYHRKLGENTLVFRIAAPSDASSP